MPEKIEELEQAEFPLEENKEMLAELKTNFEEVRNENAQVKE